MSLIRIKVENFINKYGKSLSRNINSKLCMENWNKELYKYPTTHNYNNSFFRDYILIVLLLFELTPLPIHRNIINKLSYKIKKI